MVTKHPTTIATNTIAAKIPSLFILSNIGFYKAAQGLLVYYYISSMKSKTATIFVSGNECLFLSTSFFLALLHGGSVPIIVGTMNNYVNFLFEIKTQPGVLLRPKR